MNALHVLGLESRAVQRAAHAGAQSVIIGRQAPAAHHVVIASRHQRCGGNGPLIAPPGLIETPGFGEQVAEQVERQRVRLVESQ